MSVWLNATEDKQTRVHPFFSLERKSNVSVLPGKFEFRSDDESSDSNIQRDSKWKKMI